MPTPVLHVIAGPNGAGKSTLYNRVLEPATHLPFVNADLIAAQRWPDDAAARSYEAARLAAAERDRMLRAGESFVTETVFSHPSKLDLLREAGARGFTTTLHVVVIPEALAVARVADRVANGGHQVPEDKIRERYARLWGHLVEGIGFVAQARVYDNSRAASPFRLLAVYRDGRCVTAKPAWSGWSPPELHTAGR